MSTHNIPFHDRIRKFPKFSRNICFLKLSEIFLRDSETRSNQQRLTSHRCSNNRKFTVHVNFDPGHVIQTQQRRGQNKFVLPVSLLILSLTL